MPIREGIQVNDQHLNLVFFNYLIYTFVSIWNRVYRRLYHELRKNTRSAQSTDHCPLHANELDTSV